MKGNKDKEIYNSKMCIYCKLKESCNKDLFSVFVIRDKVTMRCAKYEYDRPEESMNVIE